MIQARPSALTPFALTMLEGRKAKNVFHDIGGLNLEAVFAVGFFDELVPLLRGALHSIRIPR